MSVWMTLERLFSSCHLVSQKVYVEGDSKNMIVVFCNDMVWLHGLQLINKKKTTWWPLKPFREGVNTLTADVPQRGSSLRLLRQGPCKYTSPLGSSLRPLRSGTDRKTCLLADLWLYVVFLMSFIIVSMFFRSS